MPPLHNIARLIQAAFTTSSPSIRQAMTLRNLRILPSAIGYDGLTISQNTLEICGLRNLTGQRRSGR